MNLPNEQQVLRADLLHAIKNKELLLYYQPQFNLTTSQYDGLEALIRWQHPQKGLLLPQDFLPLAEESGLIVRIGEWVLKTACFQNKAWQDQGLPPMRIAVNVSGRQFQQKNFVEMIMRSLSESKLKPKYLELELTENMILHDEDKVIQQIQRLKNLGISIALDDFGTGYSSISYLRKVPVDRIKVDKTFIQSMNENKGDATIVRAIITLAEGLNLQVLAEGVETLKQLESLQAFDCKEVQGFYFSEPLSAKETEKFLISYSQSI